MQNEKQTKLVHQSKLSLKRSNSDSSQSTLDVKNNIDDKESCGSDQSSHKENDPCPSNIEDSLADFKSPKDEKPYKPIFNKFKIDNKKVKRKIIKPKSKSRKSTSSDISQPSIESSFFKPKTTFNQTELKESIPCPLCLKPFKDDETCTNHMKTCATKNKVSLKQLLDAKKLQDRQAEERKAMGLLATPALPEKKKGFRSKNFSTGDDPQLQLVLAMSESLYEAQQIEELEQAALLAGIPSECIKEMNDQDRKITLQKFGFTTNKPATESTTNKPRKKKLAGPTILQTRSKEDKDRVLTERIACILTGDDALTQVQQGTDNFSEEKVPTVLRSKILKEIEKTSNKLWDKSRLTKKCNNFYVEELRTHVFQSDRKVEAESHDSKHTSNDHECNILCNISDEYEPIDFEVQGNLGKEKDISILTNMDEVNSKTYEIDFIKKLISNWGETLNDSTESDVIVFVKNDQHIYVHKLVFYVQCSNILLDIEPNDTISHRRMKKKICWPDKDKLSALAFLEFIYCGSIKKYISVFDKDNLLSEVQILARLYKVKDLFAYIRNKQNELKQVNEKESEKVISDLVNQNPKQSSSQMNENESINLCEAANHRNDISINFQPTQISNSLTKHKSDPTPMIQKSVLDKVNKSLSVQNFNDKRMTASPDLFESENEEEKIPSLKTQISNTTASNQNNTNLNILIDLINDDEKEDAELKQLEENSDDHHINSQKTVVNLSRTPSPSQDIHEALTPKRMSPETGNCSGDEILDQVGIQIVETVTPKQISLVDSNSFEGANILSGKISGAETPVRNSSSTQNNFLKNINFRKENKTSNAESAKSDSSSKLDDGNFSNTKSQNIEDNFDESIYTAVTPPKSEGMKVTLDKNGLKKIKTDLSTFIDKIKKENAKSIMDSDSEIDTPDIPKPRNPFAKRLEDDSYTHLVNNGQKGHKRGISLLENQILEDENKISKHADSSKQNKTPDFAKSQSPNQNQNEVFNKTLGSASKDEIEGDTLNEVEISRYSKYKKKNKHDNSIAKYRKELERFSEENSLKTNICSINESIEKQDSSRDSSKSNKGLIKSNNEPKSQPEIQDITLVSDSDEDISQNSIVSNHCNTNKKENLTDIDKEKSQANILTHASFSSIQNDSTFPLDLIDSRIEPAKVVNSTALKEKTDHKVIDLLSESEEENIHNESTFPYALAIESDNSLKHKKIESKEANSEKSKQIDLLNKSEKINNEVDNEISKILKSSPDFSMKSDGLTKDKTNQSKKDSNKKESDQSKKNVHSSKKDNNDCEVITLSPISIISSPEFDETNENKETDVIGRKRDKNEDKECSNKNFMGFDTIDSVYFDEIQFDDFRTKSASPKSECRDDRRSHRPKSKDRSDRKSQHRKSEDRSVRESHQTKPEDRSDRKLQHRKSKDRSDSESYQTKSEARIDRKSQHRKSKDRSDRESNRTKFEDRSDRKLQHRKSKDRNDRESHQTKSEDRSDRKSQHIKPKDRSDRESNRTKSENRSDRKSQRRKSKDRSVRESQRPKSPISNSSKKILNVENCVLNTNDCAKSSTGLSKSLTSPSLSEAGNISPVLSQNRRKSRLSVGSTPIKSSAIERNNCRSRSPQEPLTDLNLDEEYEKLDEDDLPSSSYTTPKTIRKSLEMTSKNDGMTPPLDYSTLETPELRKELKKYGVKPLNRNNAKMVLRHIYNETHKVVSTQKRASSTSEDEEPPPKKKNVNSGSRTTTSKEKTKSNATKDSKDCPMIAEEMDYDDSDVPNNIDNAVSIKNVFYGLLHTNKDLYNKVLTYEPLSLESLHSMLKQKGFKCKINSLMDFLDEQCITFQVQNSKGNRTKKKK